MLAQLALLAVSVLLDTQVSIWATLISTENRIPFLWPSVGARLSAFMLSLTLVRTTTLGLATIPGPMHDIEATVGDHSCAFLGTGPLTRPATIPR